MPKDALLYLLEVSVMILFNKNSFQSDVYSDYTILTNFQLVYVVIVRSFWVNPCRFLILCLYLNCLWRFNYHEGEGWDFINWFNPTPYLSLSQTHMLWIFFALNSLRCLFVFFVIVGMIDHVHFNFLFIINTSVQMKGTYTTQYKRLSE